LTNAKKRSRIVNEILAQPAELEKVKEYHMAKGTIKGLVADRGFGFIQTVEGTELFFHQSELQDVQLDILRIGQEVEFEKGQGRDGRPRALKVRLTETQADDDGGGGGDDSG